jgi:hypothetical protein
LQNTNQIFPREDLFPQMKYENNINEKRKMNIWAVVITRERCEEMAT